MTARLTLTGPRGDVFLDRFGLENDWFGIFVHHIAGPDPGLDLHDHPWPFASLILRGGYTEEALDARDAPAWARSAETLAVMFPEDPPRARGIRRRWGRGSFHRMPLTIAHRIVDVEPGTWTLVLRGRKSRSWGFYLSDGYVDQRGYDYVARRPGAEIRP